VQWAASLPARQILVNTHIPQGIPFANISASDAEVMEIHPLFAIIGARTNYLEMLSATIELKHKCKAIHVESVPVTEEAGGEIVWAGNVEVFVLVGHPDARRCYAWIETPADGQYQFVTMIQKGFIVSPETAVKAWLATKCVTIHPVFHDRSTVSKFVTSPKKLPG
jgi:hypothetical protein